LIVSLAVSLKKPFPGLATTLWTAKSGGRTQEVHTDTIKLDLAHGLNIAAGCAALAFLGAIVLGFF
jgi:hypothetical protein